MNLQSILRFRDYAIMKRYNNAEYAYVVNGLAEQILAAGAEKLHAPAEFLTQFQERCAILDNVVAVSRIADQTGEIVAMEKDIDNYWCPLNFFYVPKIKVGFLAWNPTFFRYLCFYHKT